MLKKQSRRHLSKKEFVSSLTTDLPASEAVRKTRMRTWASRSDYTHFMSLGQWAESWRDQAPESEKRAEQQAMKHDWKEQWAANPPIWRLVGMRSLSHSMLKLYQDLHKAESFLITQICFSCINFMIFLNKTNVSDYKSFTCQCDQAQETVIHIIIHCFKFVKIKHILKNSVTDQLNIQILISTSIDTQHLTRWFMKLQILSQFQLTEQLLYERMKIDKSEEEWSDSKIT